MDHTESVSSVGGYQFTSPSSHSRVPPAPLSPLLSSESGQDCPRTQGWGGCEPGLSTCAVSQESEEERGPGHGAGASILLPEAQSWADFLPGLSYPLAGDNCWLCKSARFQGSCCGPLWFRNGLSSKGLRDGRGSPANPSSCPGNSHSPCVPIVWGPNSIPVPVLTWLLSCEVESVCIF